MSDNVTRPNHAPDPSPRDVEVGTPLHAGTLVYRVVEDDPPPDVPGRHTWKAVAVVVERASSKQIKLKKPFPGLMRTVFTPDAFGRLFFETPLQALQYFLNFQRLELESLRRREKEAERAMAWALQQPGVIFTLELEAANADE